MAKAIGIIQEILQDREKGAVRLVSEYRERLYAVAIALCNDATEAEDLVFRTFEQVLDKVETCGSEASFYSWMCAILRNFHRHSVRRPVNRNTEPVGGQTEIEPLMDPVAADGIAAAIDSNIMRQSIEQMPPKMREMLILHYFMDQPVSQIARYLMLPMGTVLSRLHYARRALARRLNTQLKKPAAVLVVLGIAILCATAAVVGAISVGAESEAPDVSSASFVPSISSQDKQGAKTMNIKATTAALMTAATTLGAMPANAEPIGSGLAAYLTFDGAEVTNRIPNATITGVTLSDSGIASGVKSGEFGHSGFGGYLDIDQGWARLDGSQNLTFENDNDFTICIWMRIEGAQVGDPVFVGNGNWSATSKPGVLLSTAPATSGWVSSLNYSDNGTSRVRVNSNDGGVSITMGKWTFYAISHTSDDKFRYFMSSSSGTLVTISEMDAPNFKMLFDAVGDRKPFYLGQDGTGAYSKTFVGKIDEFALWTRGLSPSDINAIYQNGRRGHLLDDLLKPEMTAADAGNGNIDLSFAGARSGDYELYVASGAADGGVDRFAWDYFDYVATIEPTDTSYTFALSNDIKNEGRYYRFFLTKDADYQEIEYIQNSETYATAYCHTGVNPTKDTTVVGEVEIVSGSTWDEIFGCLDNSRGNLLIYHLGFNWLGSKWYTETKKLTGGGTLQFGSGTTGVRYAFDYGVTGASCWESATGAASMYQATLDDRNSFPDMTNSIVVLRCEAQNGRTYDRSFQGKMYSIAISTNGAVACDYIPVKNASGVVGFYDAATKTFIPSETATPFTGGAASVGRLTVQSTTAKAMTASDPVTAYWIGGANGAIDDPTSWHCENSYGDTIETVPSSLTDISIANVGQMFGVPANAGFTYKSIAITAPLALTGDCDWRGVDFTKVTAAGAVDLAGHKFYMSANANLANAMTFTDLTGGGELHVEVPSGVIAENAAVVLAGALKLVKDGDGTLVANCQSQSNTGGVNVEAGTLKTTAFISTRVLGASGSKVKVGSCGTLRVESGYTGLEDYDLELAGGTLYMYNNRALSGRTTIGSMTLTADSTLHLDTVQGVGNDATCDAEMADGAVWDLGGYELTVLFATNPTDFFIGRDVTVKPVFRNGTIYLPSRMGFWQDYGSDASDHVCFRYGMINTRQRADSSTYDFVNNIPTDANFSNDGTMSVYGMYTPSANNLCFKIRMMNGSAINLAGLSNPMPLALDGASNGSVRSMTFEAGATINIELGARNLEQGQKIVSWPAIPAGVTFVNSSAERRQRAWSLVLTDSGIIVSRGFAIIIR